jgi:hypothetical protein
MIVTLSEPRSGSNLQPNVAAGYVGLSSDLASQSGCG